MKTKLVLKEIEHQLTVAVGALTVVEGVDEDDNLLLDNTKAQLIGLVHGLRNIVDHIPSEAMTLGELETAQFNRATEIVPEKDCSDVYPGLY